MHDQDRPEFAPRHVCLEFDQEARHLTRAIRPAKPALRVAGTMPA
jgi:hypothetical protein